MAARLIDAIELSLKVLAISQNSLIKVMQPEAANMGKEILEIIENCPSVDAVPVVHGYWASIDADKRGFADEFECSVCKSDVTLSYYDTDCDYAYCPWCGAKMDGDGEQDESIC